jgi:Holliday junction resolvase RusA-like endonuclease
MNDPPFALPLERVIVIDLPHPPSLNHIWHYSRKGVRPSEKYEIWKKHADGVAMTQKVFRGHKPITGRFEAVMLFAERGKGDLDNLGKAILDWCQSRKLIANDRGCRKLTLEWVEPHRAPEGCRLELRASKAVIW